MIRHALILALLVPLGIHPQYNYVGANFATAASYNACLISGWPINEGTGQTLNDVTVNANTANIGLITPAWGSNAGFPGSSLTIGGSTHAFATSTTLTNFTGTAAFSVAAWITITSGAADQVIVSSLFNAPTYIGWELTEDTLGSNTLEFLLNHDNSSNGIHVHGSTNIQNTGKHYVVATYDGSQTAAGVKLYVDGSADTVTTVQNNLTLTTANATAPGLGVRPADANSMNGVLAAVAIYNCALNSTDIATYFARGVQVN